jgi:hypothetical protein
MKIEKQCYNTHTHQQTLAAPSNIKQTNANCAREREREKERERERERRWCTNSKM